MRDQELFSLLSDIADHSFGISGSNIATNCCFEFYQFYVFMGPGGHCLTISASLLNLQDCLISFQIQQEFFYLMCSNNKRLYFSTGQSIEVFHTKYNMNYSKPIGLTFKKRMIDDTSKVLNGISICFRINIDYWPMIGDDIKIFHFGSEKRRQLTFKITYL